MYYACITCITSDSVLKIGNKNYPQVYLEELKYRVKKMEMSRFINAELLLTVQYLYHLRDAMPRHWSPVTFTATATDLRE